MMTKTTPVLGHRMIDADGGVSTVAAIVSDMQRMGFSQRLIDRWLQGVGQQLQLAAQRA